MKNNSLNLIIKILTAACVVMAVALVGIIGIAVLISGRTTERETEPNGTVIQSTENAQQEPSAEPTQNVEVTTEATTEATTEETTVQETTAPEKNEDGLIIVDPEREDWYFLVVNTSRAIPEGYVPKLETVAGTGVKMDYRVAPHYNAMYQAAKKDGIYLTPYSGYRSYERQKINYSNLTEKYMSQYNLSRSEAAKKAATVILPPGTSEHNLGLAMDVCNTYDSFANQKEYKWLMENAHKYGFILRYTAEKMPVTGIVSEPWHWRYVGVEHAEKIRNSGLCLEEYLDSIGVAY